VHRGRQYHVLRADDAGRVRPKDTGKAAEGAGDDEGDVFVQPRIVAENLHSQLALANAHEAAPERRAHDRVHHNERQGEDDEYDVEEGDLIAKVEAELRARLQVDAIVAAGERVPAIGEPPYALSERQRDHEEINAVRTNGEQPEQCREHRASERSKYE